jgi:hypothetical protein
MGSMGRRKQKTLEVLAASLTIRNFADSIKSPASTFSGKSRLPKSLSSRTLATVAAVDDLEAVLDDDDEVICHKPYEHW